MFSDVETKLSNTYINMRLPMVKSVHMKVIKCYLSFSYNSSYRYFICSHRGDPHLSAMLAGLMLSIMMIDAASPS